MLKKNHEEVHQTAFETFGQYGLLLSKEWSLGCCLPNPNTTFTLTDLFWVICTFYLHYGSQGFQCPEQLLHPLKRLSPLFLSLWWLLIQFLKQTSTSIQNPSSNIGNHRVRIFRYFIILLDALVYWTHVLTVEWHSHWFKFKSPKDDPALTNRISMFSSVDLQLFLSWPQRRSLN